MIETITPKWISKLDRWLEKFFLWGDTYDID